MKNLLKRYRLFDELCLLVKVFCWINSRSSITPWLDSSKPHSPLRQSWTRWTRCCTELDNMIFLEAVFTRTGHWKRPYWMSPLSLVQTAKQITCTMVFLSQLAFNIVTAPSNRPTHVYEKNVGIVLRCLYFHSIYDNLILLISYHLYWWWFCSWYFLPAHCCLCTIWLDPFVLALSYLRCSPDDSGIFLPG